MLWGSPQHKLSPLAMTPQHRLTEISWRFFSRMRMGPAVRLNQEDDRRPVDQAAGRDQAVRAGSPAGHLTVITEERVLNIRFRVVLVTRCVEWVLRRDKSSRPSCVMLSISPPSRSNS